MLKDDLIDLYDLIKEENLIKKDIMELKKNLDEIKENYKDIKDRIVSVMKEMDKTSAVYKDMEVIVNSKVEKKKLEKEDLYTVIEKIIEESDVDTPIKREQILNIIKPQPSGVVMDTLKIKFIKTDKNNPTVKQNKNPKLSILFNDISVMSSSDEE